MIKYNRTKNREFARFIGIAVFVLFFGLLVMVFYLADNQTLSGEVDDSMTESSLNIQKIKREMESMDRDEIERTIKEIEKEIERLNSKI